MAKKEVRRFPITDIKTPDFVRDLSYEEIDALAGDIRDYIINVTSSQGGHLSSNLGVVETTIALCRSFDFSKDKIIFDVGHQCYTYKILTGRSLERLRKKDGISGFQKMEESPYDHFEAGHSSTALSAANGMAIARDLKGEKFNVIAFVGDSSIVNGLSFEALNNIGGGEHKVIIVLNDNEMSISKPVGGLSKMFRALSTSGFYVKSKGGMKKVLNKTTFGRWLLRRFGNFKNWFKRHIMDVTIFDNLGFGYIGPVDGHDPRRLDKAFARAKKINKSVIVHVKTVKGKGYDPAEEDAVGDYHGLSSFDVKSGTITMKEGQVSWSEQYKVLVKHEMSVNDKIITIVPATGHGSALDSLFEIYPDRMIDVGIAEEHAFTLASGLAVSGYHPIISIYSTFMQRGYDEISHDLARMNLNATILIDRAGLVGSDGETHQGLYDEAFLYSIPNVTIAMASRASEALSLVKESLCNHGVFAIRYPREFFSVKGDEPYKIPYGSWKEETSGGKTAVVSTGPIVVDLKNAIQTNKMNVTLYNAVYLRPMDETKVDALCKYDKVIIYNPYATKEGFANSLEAKLLEKGYRGEIIVKCVPTAFVKQATIEEQREQFGITVNNILDLLK